MKKSIVNCDTNCIDCNFYDDCESPFKLDEQTIDFWLNERDYEPDYYEQGTQRFQIDEFTEALLDWLETPKSK